MNISFENKVALVTGAGSGMGLATAKAFAESGAAVVLADWNEKSKVRAAADADSSPGATRRLPSPAMSRMTRRSRPWSRKPWPTFGHMDAAFNNAGVQNILAETVRRYDPEKDYDRVRGINLRGVAEVA